MKYFPRLLRSMLYESWYAFLCRFLTGFKKITFVKSWHFFFFWNLSQSNKNIFLHKTKYYIQISIPIIISGCILNIVWLFGIMVSTSDCHPRVPGFDSLLYPRNVSGSIGSGTWHNQPREDNQVATGYGKQRNPVKETEIKVEG